MFSNGLRWKLVHKIKLPKHQLYPLAPYRTILHYPIYPYRMKQTLHYLFHNCEEAGRLSLMREARQLSLRQQIFLHIHLLFCRCCRNFGIISAAIDRNFAHQRRQMSEQSPLVASEEWKNKLRDELNQIAE